MKKFFVFLTTGVCFLFLSVFAACNFNLEHTHTYQTEWSYDQTYHWHKCDGEGCVFVQEKEKHTFNESVCIKCGYKNEENLHTCSFVNKTAAAEYLKSSATCKSPAIYYYSCDCGKHSEETFVYGEALGCDFGQWISNCNGTHTRTCLRDNSHTETKDCTGGNATCKSLAVCKDCNAEYGNYKEHSFEWTTDKTATKEETGVKHEECTICGLKRNENTVIDKIPLGINEVTKEEFSTALQNIKSYKYDLELTVENEKVTYSVNYDDGKYYQSGTTNGQKYEVYMEIIENNVYSYFFAENTWYRMELTDSDEYLDSDVGYLFEMMKTVEFAFADGCYSGAYTANGSNTLITVKFENKKLISIVYADEKSNSKCTVTDFNNVTVNLPENYLDYSQGETPQIGFVSYFNFNNVTVTSYTVVLLGENEYKSEYGKVLIDGKKWLETMPSFDENYNPTEQVRYFDGKNLYVNGILDTETVLPTNFADLLTIFGYCEDDFEETQAGVYFAESVTFYGEPMFRNVTVTVTDGKLSKIEIDLSEEVENSKIVYEFTKWNATVITQPENEEVSEFIKYFNFDNVTIKKSSEYLIEDKYYAILLDEEWNISEEKWLYKADTKAIDGSVVETLKFYFDGENYYLDNEKVESYYSMMYKFENDGVLNFKNNESAFTKKQDGEKVVYFAESIAINNTESENGNYHIWSDVIITIENGKISKIEYKRNNLIEIDETLYAGKVSYEFTNYNTTVVE